MLLFRNLADRFWRVLDKNVVFILHQPLLPHCSAPSRERLQIPHQGRDFRVKVGPTLTLLREGGSRLRGSDFHHSLLAGVSEGDVPWHRAGSEQVQKGQEWE